MNSSENEEETKYCFNCRRNIPLSNHVMHTAYCHRNLKLCFKCNEPFLSTEYEEHQKTMHTNISCDACSESFEAIDLDSHKLNNCPHRFQTCNYCDIDIEAVLLPEHVKMCSSRTERCNDCGQFIMLKYLVLHKEDHLHRKIPNNAKPILDESPESLAAYPPLIKKVPNEIARTTTRTTSMPTLRLRDPAIINHRASPSVKRNNDEPQINTLNNNDAITKESRAMSTETSSDDEEFPIPGAHYIHNNQSTNINNFIKNEYNNYSDELRGVQLPCEFCEKMIDSENLVLHETGCRPDLAVFHNVLHAKDKNTNNQNDNFPVPPLDLESSSSDSEINLNTLSLSSDDDDNEKNNVEKLPCEFCEELISIKKFINHQTKCEKIHLDVPIRNNLNKGDRDKHQLNGKITLNNLPKSNNIHGARQNLYKPMSAPANFSGRTSLFENPDVNTRLPTSSTFDPQTTHLLPRVILRNKQNTNRVNELGDNRFMNNSARNNYEQFLSNSRLNHAEPGKSRDNTFLYLNPSGGAIPKQKNTKTNNNRRVLNDLSKRRYSDSSSD